MALIKCIECGNEISSMAVSCPHCGCPAEYQVIPQKDGNKNKFPKEWQEILDLALTSKSGLEVIYEIRKATGMNLKEGSAARDYIIEHKTFPPQIISIINKQNGITEDNIQMTACQACNKRISNQAEVCPHCGQPTGVHVCPSCGGTNTTVLSGGSKTTSILLWGALAANTVTSRFKCKDCGHKW